MTVDSIFIKKADVGKWEREIRVFAESGKDYVTEVEGKESFEQ